MFPPIFQLPTCCSGPQCASPAGWAVSAVLMVQAGLLAVLAASLLHTTPLQVIGVRRWLARGRVVHQPRAALDRSTNEEAPSFLAPPAFVVASMQYLRSACRLKDKNNEPWEHGTGRAALPALLGCRTTGGGSTSDYWLAPRSSAMVASPLSSKRILMKGSSMIGWNAEHREHYTQHGSQGCV